jgi:hypothetical protein
MASQQPFGRPVALGLMALCTGVGAAREATAQVPGSVRHGTDLGLFGYTLANVGDVDGDGVADLLVAEPQYSTASLGAAGRVCLYSGATMALIRTHEGNQTAQDFGGAIAGAGDVDLDGFADYVVGTPNTDHNGAANAGMVVVYSGATGNAIWTVYGAGANAQFGYSVAGIGDVNGDAKSDVLVGDPYADTVTAFDENGNVIYSITGTSGNAFGWAVAACGDLDGDGIRDFVVGEPLYSPLIGHLTLTDAGRVRAYSAATGALLFGFAGANRNDFLGSQVAGIGDVDGDRVEDILTGSSWSGGGGVDAGVVVVASGKTGAKIRTTYGTQDHSGFGGAITGVADVNRDGVPDYAVGTPFYSDGVDQRGSVQLYSGADGALLYEWLGTSGILFKNHRLGCAIAGGDFNQDGFGDLVLCDFYYEDYNSRGGGWSQPGGLFEFFGCPAWSENYGAGWPGKNGIPGFVALDAPVPGDLLTLKLDNSLGAATAGLLFVGFSQANVLTGKDGTLLVDPALLIPIAVPSTGLLMTGTLPNDPALYWFDIDLQAIEADPFASKGLSFTPGLWLHCGFDLQ